jgi:hypothetical protein
MIRADVEDGNLRPNLVPVPEAFGPAEEAQVKRLICVTGFGAGDSRGRRGFLYSAAFHLLLGRVYDDKDVQEPWLKTTLVQCAWSAVRKKGSYLQAQFLRLKARRGPKKAINGRPTRPRADTPPTVQGYTPTHPHHSWRQKLTPHGTTLGELK